MDKTTTTRLMDVLQETDSKPKLEAFVEKLPDQFPGSFSEYFFSLESVKKLSNKDMIIDSGLDRTYYYQILDGRRNPGRDKVIALALAAKTGLKETQRCLEICALAPLYSRKRRDAILIYAITQGLSVMETNSLLDEFKEEILR